MLRLARRRTDGEDMLGDALTGVSMEVAVRFHLRHGAVQAASDIGRDNDDRAIRYIGYIAAAVADVGAIRHKDGHHAALEVERANLIDEFGQLGRVDASHFRTAVVQHGKNPAVFHQEVADVLRHDNFTRRAAALRQLVNHGTNIVIPTAGGPLAVGVGAVRPLGGRCELRRIVCAVIELNADVFVDIGTVGAVAHGRAVVQNGVDGEQFFRTGNSSRKLCQIAHKEVAFTLGGSRLREQGFAEAAVLKLVKRQRHGNGNVRRFEFCRAEAVTGAGNGANARQHEGRSLLLFFLVVRKDTGGAEDVHRVVGREVTVFEERLLQRNFAHRCEHEISAVNIHSFSALLTSRR